MAQSLSPIGLTAASYNQDVIAESGSNPQTVTTTDFDGANNIFYTVGFQTANSSILTSGGLPNSGMITSGGDSWQLASYSSNNVLYFPAQSAAVTKSMYLSSPDKYAIISLLDASGYGYPSFGAGAIQITLRFTDGSSRNYGNFYVYDWFDQSPYVISSLGRIYRYTGVGTNNAPATDPRMYQTSITLNATDQAKTLNRIDIRNANTNNLTTVGIFAVSGILTSAMVLSLNMNSFAGAYNPSGSNVQLNWSAANTTNTDYFEVQRSASGTDFEAIAQVAPIKDQGNTQYSYTDNVVNKGASFFYRIKDVELNGVINYTKVLLIQTAPSSTLRFVQTPGMIYVLGNQTGNTQYEVISMTGQLCLKGTGMAGNQLAIDIHSLLRGVYAIRLTGSGGQGSQSFTFLKQ